MNGTPWVNSGDITCLHVHSMYSVLFKRSQEQNGCCPQLPCRVTRFISAHRRTSCLQPAYFPFTYKIVYGTGTAGGGRVGEGFQVHLLSIRPISSALIYQPLFSLYGVFPLTLSKVQTTYSVLFSTSRSVLFSTARNLETPRP